MCGRRFISGICLGSADKNRGLWHFGEFCANSIVGATAENFVVSLEVVSIVAQYLHQFGVDKKFFFPKRLRNQNADFNQVFQIPRGRLLWGFVGSQGISRWLMI